MEVFELRWPGVSPVVGDEESASGIRNTLELMGMCVADAAVSLALFEQTLAHQQVSRHSSPWRGADRAVESAAEQRLIQEAVDRTGAMPNGKELAAIWDTARLEGQRARWRQGEVPQEYKSRIPFIHAKSFVYALDTLGKALGRLARQDDIPAEVTRQLRVFEDSFPQLVEVRNSAHHAEDRVRGMKGMKGDKPMDLQPLDDGFIKAPGGALVVDMLDGRRFGCTLADGSMGKVEVAYESVRAAQACMQGVLDCFEWRGPAMIRPF